MKRKLAIFIATILLVASLSSCGVGKQAETSAPQEEKQEENTEEGTDLKIITTIFPEYDWVRNVLGEKADSADLTMLLDNGVDLHNYQPTVDDIVRISNCDLFIYVGGESDEWVEDALREGANENRIVLNLMEVLGDAVKEEEIKEGMEAEDHDHEGEEHEEGEAHEDEHEVEEHEEGEEHDHDHEGELDEHVWLSLRNAQVLVSAIGDALSTLDSENGDTYKKNADEYNAKRIDLDKEYEEAVAGASKKTLLFGDRFPFRYLTDDYGLDYYAAFVGCSAETEASFETIKFLADKTDEMALNSVITIEGTDHRIAETIVQTTAGKNQEILSLDSMQSITSKDVEGGVTYISIMEGNLEVLKEALK